MEFICCDYCLHVSLDYVFAYYNQRVYRGNVYDIMSYLRF